MAANATLMQAGSPQTPLSGIGFYCEAFRRDVACQTRGCRIVAAS
jgi:hypothetical protein